MLLLFAETDLSGWLPIAGSGFGIILTAIVTYVLTKPKNSADTAHILAQTNGILAARLKESIKELDDVGRNIPSWKQALEASVAHVKRLEEQNAKNAVQLTEAQNEIDKLRSDIAQQPLGTATIEALTAWARSIEENISHIYFVPGDDTPSETDAGYIRRFKEMRVAAKQMVERLEQYGSSGKVSKNSP